MVGIEVGMRFESVLVVGEVVLLLRPFGHKNLEAIGQGKPVVRVFFRDLAGSRHHLAGFFLIARLERAQRGHLHVRAHIQVMALHGLHGVRTAVEAHASDILRLSSVLRDADRIQVSSELFTPFEKLLMMKEQAFNLTRVVQLLGAGATSDQVILNLKKFITLNNKFSNFFFYNIILDFRNK